MKQKILLTILILSLLSLVIFVTAQVDEDKIIVSIELEEGWNLVSNGMFAINPLENSVIQPDDISAIFYYNPKLNQYRQLSPHRDDGATELSEMVENYVLSVWIYSKRKGTLTFETDNIVKIDERKLRAGWNFISITPTFMGTSLNDLKGSCEIQKAYVWWNKRQEWKEISDGLDEEFYEGAAFARLGEGVVVKVSKDCTLGTSGSSVIPPSIPN